LPVSYESVKALVSSVYILFVIELTDYFSSGAMLSMLVWSYTF